MPPSGTGIGVDKQRVVRNVLTDYHGLLVNNLLNIHKVRCLEIQDSLCHYILRNCPLWRDLTENS